jgi:O-antigen ligase
MDSPDHEGLSSRVDKVLGAAIEAIVLSLVIVSPWPQGSYESVSRFYLSIAIVLLLVLWALRLCISRSWALRGNRPLFCLAGFFFLSVVQLCSAPSSVLSVASPGSAELYAYYLPSEREVLPGETSHPRADDRHPISVSPPDTREFMFNSLALCVLYAVVVNNAVSAGAFLRLAWACAITGAAISILAFAQRLSSPTDHVLYWSIVVGTRVYGPFDYRNIFPFFANGCIGLGLGLLAAYARKERRLLENPRVVWLFAMVALTATAVALSWSRGGLIALVAAVVLAGVAWRRVGRAGLGSGILLWLIPVVLIAVSWIGWTALESRFISLAADGSVKEGRFDVWRDTLSLFPRFPVFGTGNGCFEIMEPLTRQNMGAEFLAFPHAHNEYVEALVEGGLARFALTLTLIGVVTAAGMRNFRHLEGRTLGWLVLGGLLGLWAIALQSFVDFGMHIPAVAILAVVLTAHVVSARLKEMPGDRARLPLPICVAIAVMMVLLGGLLVSKGYQEDKAERFRNASILEKRNQKTGDPARRVAYLEAAVRCCPDKYKFRNDLSNAYLDLSKSTADPAEAERYLLDSLREARTTRDISPVYVRPHVRLGVYRTHLAQGEASTWYLERARRSSPTDPAIWYASGKERFDAGKKRFDAGDLPGAWSDWQVAWSDWRRSLTGSSRHLSAIIADAKLHATPAEFLDKVLPDDQPELLVEAALKWVSDDEPAELRRPFLAKALAALARGDGGPNLLDCRWKLAHACYEVKQFADAKRQVDAILLHWPRNSDVLEFQEVINRDLLINEP